MAEFKDREHYIPLRKNDLIRLLCGDKNLPPSDREQFQQFCKLVAATYHFEYHQRLEELKDEYAAFDPDSVTVMVTPLTAEEKQARLDGLFGRFTWLMERANFQHLDRKAIEEAMEAVSDWGINMEVDFNVFDRLEMFVRGDAQGKRSRRRWSNFYRLEEVTIPVYQRLVLILKLRPHRRLGKDVNTESVYLKIFKDIPKMDLEMLMPGARVRMPGAAQLKLGGSVVSGLGFLVVSIIKQAALIAAGGMTAIFAPLGAVIGYGYKQYHGYQVTKQTYSLQLTQSLYFQNLDNNAGVINHLLDEAEEQECREAILAYFGLWRVAPPEGWASEPLDDFVEQYLEQNAGIKVDFEIGDAIDKLERMQIVEKDGDRYRAVPIEKALEMLDYTWDNYFKYSNPESESPSA